ncbi:hypothetical protein ZIOFF_074433 (mitochondrion) [Zingiber officinale]|uniref:Uncharacterized protein n=1 Tax=Zingiber officinale TaxID=94328 RepID=A0A8J5BYH6_ZINOF|nr:hypothetical protein ZIOFF_074433 [Zingiber officinale]
MVDEAGTNLSRQSGGWDSMEPWDRWDSIEPWDSMCAVHLQQYYSDSCIRDKKPSISGYRGFRPGKRLRMTTEGFEESRRHIFESLKYEIAAFAASVQWFDIKSADKNPGAYMVSPRRRSPFGRYALLGDYIVIADRAVAERYRELLGMLGVPISESKSIDSKTGALEFAKQAGKYGLSRLCLIRLAGAGFRVRARLMSSILSLREALPSPKCFFGMWLTGTKRVILVPVPLRVYTIPSGFGPGFGTVHRRISLSGGYGIELVDRIGGIEKVHLWCSVRGEGNVGKKIGFLSLTLSRKRDLGWKLVLSMNSTKKSQEKRKGQRFTPNFIYAYVVPLADVAIGANEAQVSTDISVKDVRGRVLSWASAGTSGFKGPRRGAPYAAQAAAVNAIRTVVDQVDSSAIQFDTGASLLGDAVEGRSLNLSTVAALNLSTVAVPNLSTVAALEDETFDDTNLATAKATKAPGTESTLATESTN